MNENTLLAMFEEIKISLSEIKNRIAPTAINNNGQQEIQTIEQSIVEKLENDFDSLRGGLNILLKTHYTEEVNNLRYSIEEERKRLENFIVSESPKIKHTHLHTIDIKSSKVVFIVMALGISLFIAMAGCFYIYDKLSALEDNDLKYRYVKSMKGIDKQQLGELEKAFEYNRDEEIILKIKTHVLKHEEGLEKRARNLEQFELLE